MAVYKYKWSCYAKSVIDRNCTWWYFPRAYDIGNKINPSIPSGMISVNVCPIPHFAESKCYVMSRKFRHSRASLYKNMTS